MELVKQLDYKVNIEDIRNCLEEIMENPLVIRMTGISVQHRKGVPSPWDIVDGLEARYLYNGAIDQDFNQINEVFINTEIEKIVKDFNLFRTRCMMKEGKTCYSVHRDSTWRLHVPIFTNTDCVFYFPEYKNQYHLEAGKAYLVNTTENHTFINSSNKSRWHLVGCIDNK